MKKRIIATVLIVVAIIVALMGFSRQINSSLNTIKAQYSYFEDAIEVKGIIIRNEEVYTKEADTIFESELKEGQRVPAGSVLGTVYGKDAPKEVISTITDINSRISELRKQQNGLHAHFPFMA